MDVITAWLETAPEEMRVYCTPQTIERYLTAHRGDGKAATKGLEKTLAWRKETIAPTFKCITCESNPGGHCFFSLGPRSSDSAALIYGCPARASEGGEVEKTIAHCVNSLERQWSGSTQTWVWLVDFRGFGLSHSLQARLGMSFASIFKEHFPERLAAILLLNPPLLFKALVAAIGAVADARTIAKLQVVEGAGPTELCAVLESKHGITNPDTLAFLKECFTSESKPNNLPALPKGLEHLQV